MPAIMVHALDGSMLSSRTGIGKLLRIYRGTEAASSVFVISNVASADLAMDSLVSAAAENDERLWARLERSQKAWNEAAEAMLCQDRRSIEDMIASSFSDVEEILKAGLPALDLADLIRQLSDQMHTAAEQLQFELAARLRDEIRDLKKELRAMTEAKR